MWCRIVFTLAAVLAMTVPALAQDLPREASVSEASPASEPERDAASASLADTELRLNPWSPLRQDPAQGQDGGSPITLADPTRTPLPTGTPVATPRAGVTPGSPTVAPALSGLAADSARLDGIAVAVESAATASDWTRAQREWTRFDDLWFDVEDGFRAFSRETYRDIETAMGRASDALRVSPPDGAALRREVAAIRGLLQPFLLSSPPSAGSQPPTQAPTNGLPPLVRPLSGSFQPPSAPTPSPGVAQVPESCTAPPTLNLNRMVRGDDSLDWTARGFRPGSFVHAAVHGPTSSGSITGPRIQGIEALPVDRNCRTSSEEGVNIPEILEDNPGLTSGHYVLVVRGFQWTPNSSGSEREVTLYAPFDIYVVLRR